MSRDPLRSSEIGSRGYKSVTNRSENGAYLAQAGLIGGTDFGRERLAALPRRSRRKRAKSGVPSGNDGECIAIRRWFAAPRPRRAA
jgi:hypothetical protein